MRNLMTPETFQKEAGTSLKASAKKRYVPVDPEGVSEKIGVARRLGLKVMKMPSLPGHDAASLGAAGIPISMTFVRHDGRSHSAYETMPQNSYRIAEDVSHTFLMQKLGLVPNPDAFFSLRLE